MLPALTVERHHIFLLVTTAHQSSRVQAGTSALHGKYSMTHQPSSPIVAIVDDDPGILRSLEYLLESADYSVRLFASGTELLESGCLPQIDCLISDIDIPGIDGFELLRRVHAARPGLPIILITGYPETLKRLPTVVGTNPRLFTKPFQGPELLEAISESLRPPGG
jgi:FixJ family two-component response regulator